MEDPADERLRLHADAKMGEEIIVEIDKRGILKMDVVTVCCCRGECVVELPQADIYDIVTVSAFLSPILAGSGLYAGIHLKII